MPVRVETYERLDEAARALASSRTARFLGGGTLIMRAVNAGDQSFDTIIRARDANWSAIRAEGDGFVIGAGVTMAAVVASRDLVFLAPVARSVGGPAIRNMATIGGNLFAASPYGDFAAALLALGATVNLAGSSGRGIPIDDFLRDRERHATSLVQSVSVPRPRDASAFRFVKVSRVKPKGISLMSIAALLPQMGGRLQGARIAYGAMAPTPIRVTAVERALEGQSLDIATIERAAAVATEGIDPPTDALASSWYRREVAGVHLKRLLSAERR
ncbi:FAD binding domain-containing protein [Aquamicrobium sp. LC103]|uniref:FAD binding domain-containing protein n=1 Tax=Aquamicrobium sp. LC103 TaxID=1120658 RepID=UPI00063E8ACF|nr:FAD binding domain-containing protein [Aquamicrobium sp. LC103]TKT76218.1 xanthine dehydrogenase family protein subunit M [Aquamicrobium sp. LC103]